MSQMKPTILTNPEYATNQIDTQQAGWYQISPNSSDLALRVINSNIGLSGEIRLNTSIMPPVFQGNNGSAWVSFNASQGPIGPPGRDFTNAVNFNNLGPSPIFGDIVSLASIFATTYVNVDENLSNVDIRSLQGSDYTINSNLSVDSILLQQNSNVITLMPQPLPFNWDLQSPRNTITYLKNSSTDFNFYSWGEKSFWAVQQGATILKGQAVRITNDLNSSNVVITPITYNTLNGANKFNQPYFNVLGIALRDGNGGGFCSVCTKGVTTVLCTSNIAINSGFSPVNNTPFVGALGLVGKDGGMFCSTQEPTVDYITAGYFLENDVSITNGSYALFYVNPSRI